MIVEIGALDDFERALADVREIAEHANHLLQVADPPKRELANSVTRSGLVLLCGYFEGFVRELMQLSIDQINDIELAVHLLPESLLVGILDEAFSFSGEKRVNAISEIRDRIRSGHACVVNKKRLSSTGGNPTVDNIENLLARLGICDVIDRLSVRDFNLDSTYISERQSRSLEAAILDAVGGDDRDLVERVLEVIDSKWSPKRRRRAVGYVSAIEELLKRRNRIAHGESRELVTPSELMDHVLVISNLARGLHQEVLVVFAMIQERKENSSVT